MFRVGHFSTGGIVIGEKIVFTENLLEKFVCQVKSYLF